MGFDFLTLINNFSKFSQFKRQIEQSGQDPRQLLQNEINKRGINSQQLNELLSTARQFGNMFGLK